MTALLCTEVVAMKAAGVEAAAPATTVTSDEVVTDEKSKGAYEQLKELLVSDKQQQQQQQVRATTASSSPVLWLPEASEVTVLWRYTNRFMIVIFIIFKAHQHKAAGRKTRLDIQNYHCNGSLLCYRGVVERNRISSLQSHGKALEKECCLLGVFCDSGDMPANLLCELNGHLMPCTSCFYGKWVEDVCAIIIVVIIIYYFYPHV